MSKPWYAQYDEWAPHEIDPDKHKSVVDMLLQAGERLPPQEPWASMENTGEW